MITIKNKIGWWNILGLCFDHITSDPPQTEREEKQNKNKTEENEWMDEQTAQIV